jgi:hypothetical protein
MHRFDTPSLCINVCANFHATTFDLSCRLTFICDHMWCLYGIIYFSLFRHAARPYTVDFLAMISINYQFLNMQNLVYIRVFLRCCSTYIIRDESSLVDVVEYIQIRIRIRIQEALLMLHTRALHRYWIVITLQTTWRHAIGVRWLVTLLIHI